MKVPWAVPDITEAEIDRVHETIRSTWVTMGRQVGELERLAADFFGVRHAVAMVNGTAAIDAAFRILGIGPGDEVVIPAMTYIATANMVAYQGATPVFADIEPDHYTMDPASAEACVTSRTRCIVPIDYGGQPADMPALADLAARKKIPLVVDAAHSIGASIDGRACGSWGVMNTVSFHAAKVMTSVEGGMVLTDDPDLDARLRIFRNQGESPDEKHLHPIVGHNYRMTDLHAAVGVVQFGKLPDLLAKRAWIAAAYGKRFAPHADRITVPRERPGGRNAWFHYPILIDDRDDVMRRLQARGIELRINYPRPVYRQPAHARFDRGQAPVAERVTARILDLPMFHAMTEEQIDYVADCTIEETAR